MSYNGKLHKSVYELNKLYHKYIELKQKCIDEARKLGCELKNTREELLENGNLEISMPYFVIEKIEREE